MELVRKTIGMCLKERVEQTPDAIAVEFEGQKISWREIDQLSDWLVYRFHFLGIKKGTRAAVWCGNHLQWVIVFYGLLKTGATAVLINPGYQTKELYEVLAYAQVEYLFYGESFKGRKLTEIIDKIDLRRHPYLKQTIPIELQEAVTFMVQGAATLEDTEKLEIEALKKNVKPEDTACMLFTSGTTAVPKGVLLSHYNLVNDALATVEAMHWDSSDKTCVMVPLFHCFGVTSCLLASMIAGNSLYLMKYYRTAQALYAIEHAGCTVLNGVPSMFLAMIHNKAFSQYNLCTLKSGIIAGSAISPEEYQMIAKKLGIQKLQMSYGQTETSPGVTFSGYEDSIPQKADNAGRPLSHVELCIWEKDGTKHRVSLDGQESMHGEIGVRGFPVMQGYYNRQKETSEVLESDGWLHTRDLGYVDAKGQLHIEGRMGEMIIRGGENISPVEIEACLRTMPGIRDAKVVGVPQKVLQEEIAACIVTEKESHIAPEEIQAYVGRRLAQYKVPRYIRFFDALPCNASGKIKIGKLKEIMAAFAADKMDTYEGGKLCILMNSTN